MTRFAVDAPSVTRLVGSGTAAVVSARVPSLDVGAFVAAVRGS